MGGDLQILPIQPDDRRAVSAFVRSVTWQYTHVDYPREEVLSRPGYQALNSAGKRLGVLGCGMDIPPMARLFFAAVERRQRPREVIGALLELAERELQRVGGEELVFVGWAPWLARSLESAGFTLRTSVITYQRHGGPSVEAGNQAVRLRPAQVTDVAALVELDRAAFEPMWRYSADIHRRLAGSAAHCVIAEHDGILVGYQISDISANHGHIIRLAVHPGWQRRGVGTRLLADAIQFLHPGRVSDIMVNTQADNVASRRLYERFGFVRWAEEAPAMVNRLVSRDDEVDSHSSGASAQ